MHYNYLSRSSLMVVKNTHIPLGGRERENVHIHVPSPLITMDLSMCVIGGIIEIITVCSYYCQVFSNFSRYHIIVDVIV